MHASQIQGCVVEQRVEKKRKIAESVWVHNVVICNSVDNTRVHANTSVISHYFCAVSAQQ